MILSFSVENYRSFKKAQTFKMIGVNDKNNHKHNYIKSKKENIYILKSCIIFGPNASGKSNLIRAINALRQIIVLSTDLKLDNDIPVYEPFMFDLKYQEKPTVFDIEFIPEDHIRYKYEIAFQRKIIVSEKLIYFPLKQPTLLYERKHGMPIKFGTNLKGRKKSLESELIDNNLFLSKAANSNHQQLKKIYLYFKNNIIFHTKADPTYELYQYTTNELLKKDSHSFKEKVTQFLLTADFSISSIDIEKIDSKEVEPIKFLEKFPESLKNAFIEKFSNKPIAYHKLFSDNSLVGEKSLDLNEESAGTQKMYDLAGKLINVLEGGKTIIIDELDSSFHPVLSNYIMKLFNDLKLNPCNSQIISISNSTSLLDQKVFRRDQIWFIEKNKYGESELFSLNEFSRDEVRKNTPFERWYLNGRFGALPLIDFKKLNLIKQKNLFGSECDG